MSNYTVNRQDIKPSSRNSPLRLVSGNLTDSSPTSNSALQIRGTPTMVLTPPTQRCIGLDKSDCLMLLEVHKNPDGVLTKRIAEVGGFSRSGGGERAKKKLTEQKNFLIVKEQPQSNPKIPAANVYFSSGNWTAEELAYITQVAGTDEATQSPKTIQSGDKKPKDPKRQDLIEVSSVADAVTHIATSSRRQHLELLAHTVRLGEVTATQLVGLTQQLTSTVNTRLRRLIKVRLIDRRESDTGKYHEYVYFPAPGVNIDEIIKLLYAELGNFEFDLSPNNSISKAEVQKMVAPPPSPFTNNAPPQPQLSRFDKLAEKLPEFDPKWSDELKQKWFGWYDRLMTGEDFTSQDR